MAHRFFNTMKKKSIAANGTWSALLLIVGLAYATSSAQSVITENTSGSHGTAGTDFTLGQSVTTPDGNSWTNISFNLVDSSSHLPYAEGELFLLTSSYTGTAAGLSSSTSGFLASTTDIANGEWVFAPDVTLNPSTQYFFYMSTPFDGSHQVLYSLSDPYSGGEASDAIASGSYSASSSIDLVFTLSGTVVPVPEPTTLALAGLGGLSLLLFRRRK